MPELYVRVPQPGRDRAALRWACLGYCYFGVVTDIYHLAVVALLSAAVQSRTSSIRYSRTANALLPEMVAPIRVKRISLLSKSRVRSIYHGAKVAVPQGIEPRPLPSEGEALTLCNGTKVVSPVGFEPTPRASGAIMRPSYTRD